MKVKKKLIREDIKRTNLETVNGVITLLSLLAELFTGSSRNIDSIANDIITYASPDIRRQLYPYKDSIKEILKVLKTSSDIAKLQLNKSDLTDQKLEELYKILDKTFERIEYTDTHTQDLGISSPIKGIDAVVNKRDIVGKPTHPSMEVGEGSKSALQALYILSDSSQEVKHMISRIDDFWGVGASRKVVNFYTN